MYALLLTFLLPFASAGDNRYAEIAESLGLTAEERVKVEEIVYQSRLARTDAKAKLDRARIELRHVLAAPTLDEKAVNKAVDTINAATAETVRVRVSQIVALRKALTPAQWEKLKLEWQEEGEEEDE